MASPCSVGVPRKDLLAETSASHTDKTDGLSMIACSLIFDFNAGFPRRALAPWSLLMSIPANLVRGCNAMYSVSIPTTS
jgi:hypothetical protein